MGENIIMLFLREYHFRAFQYKKPQNGIPSHKTILTDLREPPCIGVVPKLRATRSASDKRQYPPVGGTFPFGGKEDD